MNLQTHLAKIPEKASGKIAYKTCDKTPATLEEIKTRVGFALARNPLCRNVEFDIVSTPHSSTGGNWTISLHAITPAAMWEASDIVSDIQEAYVLAMAA